MATSTNPYTVLNLRKGATEEEIKQAYFEMVKRWDPERHTERFMVIQQAYEKLRDPQKRAKEDLFTYNYVRGEFNFTAEEKGDEPTTDDLMRRLTEAEALVEQGGEAANGARGEAVTLLLTLSFRHFRRKQWREAIDDLVRALRMDPTNQRGKNNLNLAYMRLGWSYATNNLIKEAIELWELSLQMNPDNLPIIHNLAIATESDGDRDRSERYWGETLRRWKLMLDEEPENDYIKSLIIEIHKHFGGRRLDTRQEGEAAIEEYKEVLKINPDDFEAQMKIAETLMEEKRFSEAVAELRKMVKRQPTNVQVLNLFSWALLNSGEIDAAFTNWQRCLKIDPKNYSITESIVKARFDLGRKCRDSGQFTPALVHFKALLKLFPKNAEVHRELAKTYLGKGDRASAYKHLQLVVRLDPKDREAKRMLSELKMGR
jgi:tetratricopeptide (TPR) repeat protein